jgi:hypothetical protein
MEKARFIERNYRGSSSFRKYELGFSIGLNRIGFLPEEGNRVQSPKRDFMYKL